MHIKTIHSFLQLFSAVPLVSERVQVTTQDGHSYSLLDQRLGEEFWATLPTLGFRDISALADDEVDCLHNMRKRCIVVEILLKFEASTL